MIAWQAPPSIHEGMKIKSGTEFRITDYIPDLNGYALLIAGVDFDSYTGTGKMDQRIPHRPPRSGKTTRLSRRPPLPAGLRYQGPLPRPQRRAQTPHQPLPPRTQKIPRHPRQRTRPPRHQEPTPPFRAPRPSTPSPPSASAAASSAISSGSPTTPSSRKSAPSATRPPNTHCSRWMRKTTNRRSLKRAYRSEGVVSQKGCRESERVS